MKKLLSLCLTLCMAFTLAAPALADDGDTSTACIQADDGRVELYNENCPKYQAPLGNEVPADLVPMPVFDMKNAIDNNWEHCTSCSKESPHLISTAADLDKIRTHLSTETTDGGTLNIINGFFQLTNDISFSPADFQSGGAFFRDGKGWLPIGAAASTGETPAAFLGWLDGNGFAIKNLLINNFVGQNGLFTQVRGEYGVENLHLVDF